MDENELPVWEQEPQLLRWQVRTWEHAALFPETFGLTGKVQDSKRMLPEELTAPIYAALAAKEANLLRWTDPLPPFDARLVRDPKSFINSDLEDNVSQELVKLMIDENRTEGGCSDIVLTKGVFSDVAQDWEAQVRKALGANLPKVEQNIRNIAPLGVPRDGFSIHYGYRIDLTLIPGRHADPRIETHRSLLMGCDHELLQPGLLRDFTDLLRS